MSGSGSRPHTLADRARRGSPVDRDLLRAIASEGILDMLFPEGHGRLPPWPSARSGRRSATLPGADVAMSMQGIGGYPILLSGSCTRSSAGSNRCDGVAVAGFALTEPESARTRRRSSCGRDRTRWVDAARPQEISPTPLTRTLRHFRRTTENARSRGVTAFLVPADGRAERRADRVHRRPPIGTSPSTGVHVDRADVIGEVDRGFVAAMTTFDLFRPSSGPPRSVWGRPRWIRRGADGNTVGLRAPIGSNQAVAHASPMWRRD